MELKETDVQKRIDEINNKIENIYDAARKEAKSLEAELQELEEHNYHFYVAKLVYGDLDYWDEEFYLLGYTTEAYAKQWVAENSYDEEDLRYSDAYYEVSNEEYSLLTRIAAVDRALRAISRTGIPLEDGIVDLLSRARKDLAKPTTLIQNPSCQYVYLEEDR